MTTKIWDGQELARKLIEHSVSMFSARPKLEDVPSQLVEALRLPAGSAALDSAAVARLVEAVKEFAAWNQSKRGWLSKKSLERSRQEEDFLSFTYVSVAFGELAADGWPHAEFLRKALLSYSDDIANEPVKRFFSAYAGLGLCNSKQHRTERAAFDRLWHVAREDWFDIGQHTADYIPSAISARPLVIPKPTTYAEQRFRELTGPGSHMGNHEAARIVQQETGLWVERPL